MTNLEKFLAKSKELREARGPKNPNANAEALVFNDDTAAIKDEMIRVMAKAIDRLQKHAFDKLNKALPEPTDFSEICMARQAIARVEELAK